MISGALEGTVCIDVSGHVAGPYASSLLGDLGCEVIKVELPNGGDTHRGRNPNTKVRTEFSPLKIATRSLPLDLRPKRCEIFAALATADIFSKLPPSYEPTWLDYTSCKSQSEIDSLLHLATP